MPPRRIKIRPTEGGATSVCPSAQSCLESEQVRAFEISPPTGMTRGSTSLLATHCRGEDVDAHGTSPWAEGPRDGPGQGVSEQRFPLRRDRSKPRRRRRGGATG